MPPLICSISILLLAVILQCQCQSNVPAKVSISYTELCDANVFKCFLSLIQCVNGQELVKLKLQWPSSGFGSLNGKSTVLALTYDKTSLHYEAIQRTWSEFDILQTDIITNLFYKTASNAPKQFKSVGEFYGEIEDVNNSYVRAIIHFVSCRQINVYAFVRAENMLYQIRPQITKRKSDEHDNVDMRSDNHEIITDLDVGSNDIFTSESKAFRQSIQFNKELMSFKKLHKEMQTEDMKTGNFLKIEPKYCSK